MCCEFNFRIKELSRFFMRKRIGDNLITFRKRNRSWKKSLDKMHGLTMLNELDFFGSVNSVKGPRLEKSMGVWDNPPFPVQGSRSPARNG